MSGGRNSRWVRTKKLAKYFILAVIIAVMAVGGLVPLAQAEPLQGDYFTYNYKQEVTNGGGGYYGWSEKTVSHGRYDVVSKTGQNVEMTASYSWTYDASDSPKTPVHDVNLNFSYSSDTRRYVYGYDLDVDYGPDPSVWFWIPTDVVVGQRVRILDSNFTVESLDATIWSNHLPKKAIMLVERGSGDRNDVYGQMHYTYTDRYYMDKDTGYIIAERYSEHDSGYWSGISSSFDWYEGYDVVSSSYAIPVDWLTLATTILLILAAPISIFVIAYFIRWNGKKIENSSFDQVKIYRIRNMTKYPHLQNKASILFEAFLEDFVKKALLSGGRVAIATSSSSLEGLAIYHKDVKVGVIFCKDYGINEALRKFIGAKDFFSEIKHQLGSGNLNYSDDAESRTGQEAYNIFETSRVLKLSELPETGYDAANFRLMREEDLKDVEVIAKNVYKVRSKRWIRSLMDTGDIGVVATVDGKIVGFAFATVIDDVARFHTLTVAPKMRGGGLAKELMRARLHFVKALGVKEVILEIADWNLPSLTVSTSFRFKKAGSMYVETVRTRRVKKNIVRRW